METLVERVTSSRLDSQQENGEADSFGFCFKLGHLYED